MKMTNEFMGTMVNIMTPMNETGKLGYAIAYNLRKMADESKEYLQMRDNLLKKYGVKTGQGYSLNEYKNPEEYKKFKEEMGDVPNVEHDIDIMKVTPEELYSGHMTSQQMANLMWMVDDGKPEKVEGEVV